MSRMWSEADRLTKRDYREITMAVMDYFSLATKTMGSPTNSHLLFYGINAKDLGLYQYIQTKEPTMDLKIEDIFYRYFEGNIDKAKPELLLYWMRIERKIAENFVSRMAAPMDERIKIFKMAEKITDTREHATEVTAAIVGYGKMLYDDVVFNGGFKKNSGPKEEFIGFFESREKVKFMGTTQTQDDRLELLKYYDELGGIDDELTDLWHDVYQDVYRSRIYGREFSAMVTDAVYETSNNWGI